MATGDLTATTPLNLEHPAAYFDGVDDEIEKTSINGSLPYIVGQNPFTISIWSKITDVTTVAGAPTGNLISLRPSNLRGIGIQILKNNSRVQAMIRNDSTNVNISSTGTPVGDNSWHHYLIVSDGTNWNFYIDGTSQGSTTTLTTVTPTSLAIGGNNIISGDSSFSKILCRDVKVYKINLTSQEISDLYGGVEITRGLIGQWKLNGDATDSVGGNDGTVTGAIFTSGNNGLNNIVVDAENITQTLTTDKVMPISISGRDGKFGLIGVGIEAA